MSEIGASGVHLNTAHSKKNAESAEEEVQSAVSPMRRYTVKGGEIKGCTALMTSSMKMKREHTKKDISPLNTAEQVKSKLK